MFTTGIYQLILLSCALYTQSKLVYCLLSATVIIEKLFALLSFFIYRQMSNPPRTYSLCSVSGKSKTQCSSSITFCFSSSDFSFSICRALLCMNYKSKTNEYHTDYKLYNVNCYIDQYIWVSLSQTPYLHLQNILGETRFSDISHFDLKLK